MVELLVGIESNVARRNATDAEANLCLSLLVMPAPVGGAPLPSAAEAAASRESLDVRCLDEMQFGQWVRVAHAHRQVGHDGLGRGPALARDRARGGGRARGAGAT